MLTVTCNICKEKDPTNVLELKSNVIARSDQEAMQNLGQEMLAHLQNSHPEALKNIVMRSIQVNAIMVMKNFDSLDETYLEQRELIRDQVCEFIMEGAPDDDENESEVVVYSLVGQTIPGNKVRMNLPNSLFGVITKVEVKKLWTDLNDATFKFIKGNKSFPIVNNLAQLEVTEYPIGNGDLLLQGELFGIEVESASTCIDVLYEITVATMGRSETDESEDEDTSNELDDNLDDLEDEDEESDEDEVEE